MWEMARNIAAGNELGDIGTSPASEPEMNMGITVSNPYFLLGFLDLYRAT